MQAKPLPRGEKVLSTQAGYDRWSEIYETDGNPLVALEEPVAHAMLGDVRGLDVLDLGCGTGRHTLWLAAEGARVTAADFSAGMLEKARSKPGAESVHFVQHDVGQPLPFADASFDRVISALVLEHVADLDAVTREIARVCRPGGRIVLSHMHPAMMLIGVQAGFTDPATGEKMHPKAHPYQVSDYVMSALRARLVIDDIVESSVDDELARTVPRAEKYLGWLLLLAMRLRPGR
jgi:ubiquinone/menaquinone biosynthesis C-methylase UbiE